MLVSEEEIKRAMKLIAVTDREMIEGAAGVALAAEYQGKKFAVVLRGKNIVLDNYLKAVA
ncbi:hypothetical protein AT03_00745 [Hafnia alvei FB1]|uniref:Uncharacterized protein n=1 Tax=Hafnia alvei FB1 TaxID=1453496 RepID=A0A097QX79_HAFAL|nr:hypothetical protein AT03_00745 [Hafnia alvei FB1]